MSLWHENITLEVHMHKGPLHAKLLCSESNACYSKKFELSNLEVSICNVDFWTREVPSQASL